MEHPVAAGGPPAERSRPLRAVPALAAAAEPDAAALAAELAAALRAVRAYVPHRIWWEAGPAEALLAYQAAQGT